MNGILYDYLMKKLLAIIVLGLFWSDIVFAHHDGFIQHSWGKPAFIIALLAAAYWGWLMHDLEKYNKGEKKSSDFFGGLAYLTGPVFFGLISLGVFFICAVIIWVLYFEYIIIILFILFGAGWIVLKISEKKKW